MILICFFHNLTGFTGQRVICTLTGRSNLFVLHPVVDGDPIVDIMIFGSSRKYVPIILHQWVLGHRNHSVLLINKFFFL